MPDNTPLTIGVDHIGLAVKNLESAQRFFCECLGWKVVGENQNYPACFVSDGNAIVTLWQVEDPQQCVPFDRRQAADSAARLKHCTHVSRHGPAS